MDCAFNSDRKKENNKITVCIDFSKGLNVAIDIHKLPLLNPDNQFATLNDGTFFSHLDLSDAYLPIDQFSQRYNFKHCLLNTLLR